MQVDKHTDCCIKTTNWIRCDMQHSSCGSPHVPLECCKCILVPVTSTKKFRFLQVLSPARQGKPAPRHPQCRPQRANPALKPSSSHSNIAGMRQPRCQRLASPRRVEKIASRPASIPQSCRNVLQMRQWARPRQSTLARQAGWQVAQRQRLRQRSPTKNQLRPRPRSRSFLFAPAL